MGGTKRGDWGDGDKRGESNPSMAGEDMKTRLTPPNRRAHNVAVTDNKWGGARKEVGCKRRESR